MLLRNQDWVEAIIVIGIPIIVIQSTEADIGRIIPIPTAREEHFAWTDNVVWYSLIPNIFSNYIWKLYPLFDFIYIWHFKISTFLFFF